MMRTEEWKRSLSGADDAPAGVACEYLSSKATGSRFERRSRPPEVEYARETGT
jgi:hypothetical protein